MCMQGQGSASLLLRERNALAGSNAAVRPEQSQMLLEHEGAAFRAPHASSHAVYDILFSATAELHVLCRWTMP